MSEPNGNGGGMGQYPMWVRVCAQIGFPIVLALWLIFRADPLIHATSRLVAEHKQEYREQMTSSTAILRAICRSVAKSDATSSECDR